MSAQELKDAAKVLRERAEAATSGPWTQNGFEYDDASDSFTYDVTTDGTFHSLAYSDEKGDADYVATMHPGVGLLLADWLADEALMIETSGRVTNSATVALARAILGRD